MYRFQLGPTENHWNVVRNADPGDSVLTWSSYILMRAPVLKIFSVCFAGQKDDEETLRSLVYFYKTCRLRTAGVDSCCRQDPCSSIQIKSKAALGWKGNCFVCLTLFPQFLYPNITVNKEGNKKITIDLFSFFFFHQRSLRKRSCLSQKQPELFSLDSNAQVWIIKICILQSYIYRDSMLKAKIWWKHIGFQ